MQLKRRTIERGLAKKGFVRKDTHHRYFHLILNGKDTGVYTYTSHGTRHQTYPEGLLRRMKDQLKLDSLRQLEDLINCPMTAEQYAELLAQKGLVGKRRKK